MTGSTSPATLPFFRGWSCTPVGLLRSTPCPEFQVLEHRRNRKNKRHRCEMKENTGGMTSKSRARGDLLGVCMVNEPANLAQTGLHPVPSNRYDQKSNNSGGETVPCQKRFHHHSRVLTSDAHEKYILQRSGMPCHVGEQCVFKRLLGCTFGSLYFSKSRDLVSRRCSSLSDRKAKPLFTGEGCSKSGLPVADVAVGSDFLYCTFPKNRSGRRWQSMVALEHKHVEYGRH